MAPARSLRRKVKASKGTSANRAPGYDRGS